jgi:hypothetical protein
MSDDGYWFLALGLGLVVAVVAVVLLEMFLRQVHRVERDAGLVWKAGKQVARNTATTWLLGETSLRLDELTDEAGRHGQLLRNESVHPSRPKAAAGRSTSSSKTAGRAR